MRAAVIFLLVFPALGCGAPHERVLSSADLPPSDRDPLPYTPAPAVEGRTDETVALAVAGGEDQARRMLPALIAAVRDADEHALVELLADPVAQVLSPETEPRPREAVVQRILVFARRGVLQPDVDVGELVDLPNVRASRAAQFFEGRELPAGTRPTDVVLEIPLLEAGRTPLRALLHWHLRGTMVVRPGRDARIVAL